MDMMATHPPLEARIQRIDASLLADVDTAPSHTAPPPVAGAAGVSGLSSFAVAPEQVVASVGAPRAEHLDYARQLLAALPDDVNDAVRTPAGAVACVYALLQDGDATVRARQLAGLKGQVTDEVWAQMNALSAPLTALGPGSRLPVADLCVVALRSLDAAAYADFSRNVAAMVSADEQVDLFEYALQRMLKRNLLPHFEKVAAPAIRHTSLAPLQDACSALLSSLAHWGADETGDAERAFRVGADALAMPLPLMALDACGLNAVDTALDAMLAASHAVRKRILDACVHCVASDNRVTVEEAELIRAVADALECPMPPLFG